MEKELVYRNNGVRHWRKFNVLLCQAVSPLVLFFPFLLLTSCHTLLSSRASWNFMQDANIKIEPVYENNKVYYLPFSCDLKKYNSAPLFIMKYKKTIKNNEIRFYLIYTLGNKENIKEINLGKIRHGNYKLYYIDENNEKVFMKEIIIE
jgi:hypothetical protein